MVQDGDRLPMSKPEILYYASTEEQVRPFVKGITDSQFNELRGSIQGPVYRRGDVKFNIHSKLFNGAIRTRSCLLACPLHAKDISQIVLFCRKHSLTPSVKSGGYGTHGLSVEGDVIIDMSNLHTIEHHTQNSRMGSPSSAPSIPTSPPGPNPDELPRPLNDWPRSILDVALPPDVLHKRRRTAAEAFGDEDDNFEGTEERPLLSVATPSGKPASNPTLGPGDIDQPIPEGDGLEGTSQSSHTGSSATEQSGSSQHQSLESVSRRTRPRINPPEQFPDNLDVVLNRHTRHGGKSKSPLETSEASPAPTTGSGSHRATPQGPPFSMHSSSPPTSEDDTAHLQAQGVPLSVPSSSEHADEGSTQHVHSEETSSASTPSVRLPSPPAMARDAVETLSSSASGPFSYPMAVSEPSSSSSAGPFSYTTIPPPAAAQPSLHSNYTLYPVEPDHPFVYVTFGAGATQKDVDAYMTANPLQGTSAIGTRIDVPYYVPFAAHPVGSTVMMLGGFGFLARLHGLSLDILVEVEMVLADGRIVTVSENENPDLWWAIKGAGTAFGIATRYKAKAFPVPVVYAGNIVYEFNVSTAASLLKHFRDCIKAAPRELYANAILTAGPRFGGALIVIQLCYIGTREQGIEFPQAIISWDGGPCLLNEVNEKNFSNQQDSVAKILKAAAGRKWFLRSDTVTTLNDDVIHQTVRRFSDTPDGCAWLFELGGGAVVDFEDSCVPAPIRQASFNIVAFHQWPIEETDRRCVESAEDWMVETVHPHSPGGPLPCFLERREKVSRTIGVYGEANWQRLCDLKRKYDPNGLFRHNFWPLDETGKPIGLFEPHIDADGGTATQVDRGVDSKGKSKDSEPTGNHFMDLFLRP
ncbi:hypothetical protein FRC03_009956 [Tulasnella sp. 419]|nr:hypothetical protein FRC03_009956 [Tulasnella sp. 419]